MLILKKVLDNTANITSTYDFTYTLVTTGTERVFAVTDLEIAPTNRAVIEYGTWSGSGPITQTITGTLPGMRTLYNLTDRLQYLPLIVN